MPSATQKIRGKKFLLWENRQALFPLFFSGISGEVGIGKPDPRIFTTVLERLGISAEMAIMVGNSLKSDIAGAHQVGLKAVWLNRDKKDNDNSVKPDCEITNLSKLQAALNNLE